MRGGGAAGRRLARVHLGTRLGVGRAERGRSVPRARPPSAFVSIICIWRPRLRPVCPGLSLSLALGVAPRAFLSRRARAPGAGTPGGGAPWEWHAGPAMRRREEACAGGVGRSMSLGALSKREAADGEAGGEGDLG